MAQSLVLSIDVCPGLGISSLRTKHLAEFSLGRSWPNIGPGIIFSGFSYSLNCFWKICAHSERYRNLLAGIFEIRFFYGNIAFPLSPVSQQLFLFLFLFLFSSIYQALSDGSTWKPERSGTFGWLIMAYLCLQVWSRRLHGEYDLSGYDFTLYCRSHQGHLTGRIKSVWRLTNNLHVPRTAWCNASHELLHVEFTSFLLVLVAQPRATLSSKYLVYRSPGILV